MNLLMINGPCPAKIRHTHGALSSSLIDILRGRDGLGLELYVCIQLVTYHTVLLTPQKCVSVRIPSLSSNTT